MTIIQAIQRLDALKPNTYSTRQKILWLSQLEAMVKTLVMDAHMEGEGAAFTGFTENTDPATVLFMAEPFDMAYLYWLEAQIHYANEDLDMYNSAMGMFHSVFGTFKAHYKQTHTGRNAGRFRF